MTGPNRDTTAGRAYLELQAQARRQSRPTDELLVLYILERFLYRLSVSTHRNRLILKGGMLLAAFDQRRPTADVDLLAQRVNNDATEIAALVRDILSIDIDDGVIFEPGELRAAVTREAEFYSGVRIVVPARIARARHPLRVDVNVGDPVTPTPVEITYPGLLGPTFGVLGYPLATVLAEKIVTMIDRGDTTTRDRDFADVYLLTRRHTIEAAPLADALHATGAHRHSDLRPLSLVLRTLAATRQPDWERFVNRSGLGPDVPADYADVIAAIADFADPIILGHVTTGAWNPAKRSWRP